MWTVSSFDVAFHQSFVARQEQQQDKRNSQTMYIQTTQTRL